MADDAHTSAEEQSPKSKFNLKMILIMAGVLLLEGGVISLIFIMKEPAPAEASEPIGPTADTVIQNAGELELISDFVVNNFVQGANKRIMVTINVVVTYEKDEEDPAKQTKLEKLIAQHQGKIKDRIRSRIAEAAVTDLKDPKLEVIKRVIKSDIEGIIGQDLIEDILMPLFSVVPTY